MTRNVQCPVCRGRFATGVTEPGARFLCPFCQTELALPADLAPLQKADEVRRHETPDGAAREQEGEA